MARASLTPQQCAASGITPSFAAASVDGAMIPGSGDVLIEVKNAGGSPVNVTIQTPLQAGGLDLADQVVSVPATSGDKIIGPFRQDIYNRPVGAADAGYVYIDFSAVASVTVAAYKIGA